MCPVTHAVLPQTRCGPASRLEPRSVWPPFFTTASLPHSSFCPLRLLALL